MAYTKDELWTLFEGLLLESEIGKRSGNGKVFQAKATDLHLTSVEKALRYGFQRWLNDRVGGSDITDADKHTDTELFLAKVMDGTWRHEAKAKGVDTATQYNRKAAIQIWKDNKTNPKVKAWLALKGDELVAAIDGFIVKNAESVATRADALRQADAEYTAKIAKLAEGNLGLTF